MMLSGGITLPSALADASNPRTDESRSVYRVNVTREGYQLHPLTIQGDLAEVARRHSEDMAARGVLEHNSQLANQVNGWYSLGENVGRGGSADDIHEALMASQTHRDNVLGDYTEVGVGVAWAGDIMYLTQVFRTPESAAPAAYAAAVGPTPIAEPAPEPTPAPAPAAVAPPPAPAPGAVAPARRGTERVLAGPLAPKVLAAPITQGVPAPVPPAPAPAATSHQAVTLVAQGALRRAPAVTVRGGVIDLRPWPPSIAIFAATLLSLVVIAQVCVIWRRYATPASLALPEPDPVRHWKACELFGYDR
jgi:hypothetical protein